MSKRDSRFLIYWSIAYPCGSVNIVELGGAPGRRAQNRRAGLPLRRAAVPEPPRRPAAAPRRRAHGSSEPHPSSALVRGGGLHYNSM